MLRNDWGVANIFEIPSKDENITPGKARKSRQMQFRDKKTFPLPALYPNLLMPYIFRKLLLQRLIWHIWGPAMCIL